MTTGPDYIFTMHYDCLIIRRSITNKPGMYRVIVTGWAANFMDSFDAVVDDFGNLVKVQA